MSSRLIVETREFAAVEELLPFTAPDRPLAWLRRGDGIVGAGDEVLALRVPADAADADVARTDATRTDATRPGVARSRSARLAAAWQQVVSTAEVDDPVGLPGTGLVAFGALTFDERSAAESVLVVPSTVIGRHRGRTWLTRIGRGELPQPPEPLGYGPHWAGRVGPGAQTPERYQDAVRRALARIAAGELSKVVVARDLTGTAPADADLRRLVRALATEYPDTWTFAVDGLIGASPETLVTVRGGAVTARVLAGTIARGADPDADTAASTHLATSTKDLDEHQYAVQSVLAALRPHTTALAASEQPFLLKLPNLFHLATDVEGELSDGSTALDLIGALHPTAAVAGTPTDAAIAAIRELEPFDRGRYAGPVGWVDAAGNGEWAIALRCAQFGAQAGAPAGAPGADGGPAAGAAGEIPVTAYAGAGIVAGSDPEAELLETRVKFRPLVDALA